MASCRSEFVDALRGSWNRRTAKKEKQEEDLMSAKVLG